MLKLISQNLQYNSNNKHISKKTSMPVLFLKRINWISKVKMISHYTHTHTYI